MELEDVTHKVTIRKIGRSLYALIPSAVVKNLEIKEGEEVTIMIDVNSRILAYKFK